MRLRAAVATDAPAIAALLRAAFRGEAEAMLVARLRAESAVAIELVAEVPDGAILGHILFSPLRVGGVPALALAPLSVAPEAQRQGIGAALAREGLAQAALRPEGWCLVLGEPGYYARFGFSPDAAATVTGVPWSGHPAFQALRLRADAAPLAGEVRYADAFNTSSQQRSSRPRRGSSRSNSARTTR